MLKKITAVLMAALLLAGSVVCALPAFADEGETPTLGETVPLSVAERAGQFVSDATTLLFSDATGAVTVSSVFKNIFLDIGYVKTAISLVTSFLQLTGVIKDPTAEAFAKIQAQLTDINERLKSMDGKLDDIIKNMSALAAKTDFNHRDESARDYRRYFSDFKRDYGEKGLNALITEFEALQIDAIHKWYNATTPEARVNEITDNSEVYLLYGKANPEDEEETLIYTLENGVPEDFDGTWIKIGRELLPLKSDLKTWNVDTYRDELFNYIHAKIDEYYGTMLTDIPDGTSREVFINRISEDALNLLIYRTTAEEVNKSASFAKNVKKAFEDYKYNLLRPECGFDAAIKSLYFTHAFEYEIKDSIKELCAELTFETAYYGSFVRDILAMSNDIKQTEREEFDASMCDAIIKLDDIKNSALTGKDTYCYLTNTVLYYGNMTMGASAQVKTARDGPDDIYKSFTASSFSVNIYKYDGKLYTRNQLIGNDAASLISLTLRSNGINADHAYFNEHLSNKNATNQGGIIVALDAEKDLPLDASTPLLVHRIIGDYFDHGGVVTLSNFSSKLDKSYLGWHRMIQGSLYNFASGTLSANTVVAAFGVYGESHWYWSDDESAFLTATGSTIGAVDRSYQQVCTKDYGKRQYDNNYAVTFKYNCIIQEALVPQLQGAEDETNPLYSFRTLTNYTAPSDDFTPVEVENYESLDIEESKGGLWALIIVPSAVCVVAAATVVTVVVVKKKKAKAK